MSNTAERFHKAARHGFRWVRILMGVCRLGNVLIIAAADYLWNVSQQRHQPHQARALWQMRTARRLALPFGLRTNVIRGQPPPRGALVCNHLGYLDILALAAQRPCVFIAKHEVRMWPLLGWLAKGAGTVYIDRRCPRDVLRVIDAMHFVFADKLPLIFFPEGTSTDGAGVLPFKTSLFAGLWRSKCPVFAAAIDYSRPHGSVAEEVAYWGDMTLLPHLLNLLARPGVEAHLSFATHPAPANLSDRKVLARVMHQQVVSLRAGEDR